MANTRQRAEAQPSRDDDTRETSARQWQPSQKLPEPAPQEGVTFKYVRKSMMGTLDPTNFSQHMREGWEPCRLEDHPELALAVDVDAQASGLVEIGGLVLCKIPTEMANQRKAHYNQRAQMQEKSVDENLMREEDSRMPLIRERKSSTSFGSGNT
jgi:hypothetical protein